MRRLRYMVQFAKHNSTVILFYGLVAGFFLGGALLLWAASIKTPDLSSFEFRKVEQSTKIYDRTGEVLLYDLHEDVQRTVIPFEEISRNIKNATVAIEDAEFYEHIGVRPLATIRAVLIQPLRGKGVQGGSTITQQVVKNSILTNDRTISRKLKEWILAIRLEQTYSKERILEFYLNETPYGGNMYGIEEASRRFFGESARDITLAEAAYLAALPQAPTYYSPYGNNREALEERKNLVLAKMLENKFVTEEEYIRALEEKVEFEKPQDTGIKAPHFVFFVQEYLEQKYGRRALEERGFRVITTLDWDLQQKAEDIVLRYALENVEKYDAENAALTAVDPQTGGILVMVGSRDYFDEEIDGNFNVAVAPNRQPGSAFKPFVYAEALRSGYTPETVVFDLQTQFSTTCAPDNYSDDTGCYTPGNYDNIFRGPVTFREALAQSINIPAIKVLYLSGLVDSLRLAQSMGIQSLDDINRYGLTLVLGGGEVSLIDMVSAYSVFANEGARNPYTAILRIEDADGNLVEEFTPRPRQVLDEQVALQISDILSDNVARTPAFGASSYLHFPGRDVAVKTGTTNEYRDAWIIGYTPTVAVGAWAGNNNNSPMEKRVAGFIIAPLWNEFMQVVLARENQVSFKSPIPEDIKNLQPILRGVWQGGVEYIVDSLSGKLATEYTPEELQESKVVTDVHSILHWVDRSAPRGGAPQDPQNDPQYRLWEYGVQKWKEERNIISETEGVIPKEYDSIHTPQSRPIITITSPHPDTLYTRNSQVTVSITSVGQYPISKINVFVNGMFVGSSSKSPFTISFIPNDVSSIQEINTLTVVGYDTVFNQNIDEVIFYVQ